MIINYYSKYLKYKNKYLKLKNLYGGNQLHTNYESKKLEKIDNVILNDFFKDANFSKQDEMIEKYEAKTDEDKKKLLDNIFTANKDLYSVFIKILNKSTKEGDEEKFNSSLNKGNNSVKVGKGEKEKEKTEEEKKAEEERIAAEKKAEEEKHEEKHEEEKANK